MNFASTIGYARAPVKAREAKRRLFLVRSRQNDRRWPMPNVPLIDLQVTHQLTIFGCLIRKSTELSYGQSVPVSVGSITAPIRNYLVYIIDP